MHGKDYNQCIWALSASTLSCPLENVELYTFQQSYLPFSHSYACTVDVLQCLRIRMEPSGVFIDLDGRSPQSCTETDFEIKTSNLVLFLLISVVSVHFRAIDDETIPCQA